MRLVVGLGLPIDPYGAGCGGGAPHKSLWGWAPVMGLVVGLGLPISRYGAGCRAGLLLWGWDSSYGAGNSIGPAMGQNPAMGPAMRLDTSMGHAMGLGTL